MPSRNWETTRYKRSVAICHEDYDYLVNTKSRKSIAGRLEQIIKFYRQANPGDEENINKRYDINTAKSNSTQMSGLCV